RLRWALAVVFAVSCMFAGYFFALSPFFAVREIAIIGNKQVSSQKIIQLSGIESGDNIFAVNSAVVEQWLQIEPKIQSAEISRSLSGKLTITVAERKAVAFIAIDKAFVEIDAEGRILSRYATLTDYALPLITGLPPEINKQAMVGSFLQAQGLKEALSIVRALPDSAADIGEIDVIDTQQIRLYTLNGVEVRIGDCANIADKYLVASGVINNHSQSGNLGKLKYIDVSSGQAVICYKR
ncbi:MAG: FtsQ-type POTRA domain-containing protein, partial [Clostridiales bacterium]